MKDIIIDVIRKLSYKNISMDTTSGRNIMADEILNAINHEIRKRQYTEPDGIEIGTYEKSSDDDQLELF